MSQYKVGPQDTCVQCGESKAAVKASQQRGQAHAIHCAIVDYWGECTHDWDRHKFTWTHTDQDRADAENAHWEALYRAEEEKEAAMTPTPKNETLGVTSAEGATNPANEAPTPLERHQAAVAARDRLHEATKEAFPRNAQYRPTGDRTGIVGSDAK